MLTALQHRRVVLGEVVALAISILVLGTNATLAHEFSTPFKWNTSVAIHVESRNSYTQQISSASNNYYNDTDLEVDYCATYGCGNVIHVEGDYGANG